MDNSHNTTMKIRELDYAILALVRQSRQLQAPVRQDLQLEICELKLERAKLRSQLHREIWQ